VAVDHALPLRCDGSAPLTAMPTTTEASAISVHATNIRASAAVLAIPR